MLSVPKQPLFFIILLGRIPMNCVIDNELPYFEVIDNAVVALLSFSDAVGIPMAIVDFVEKFEDDTPGQDATLTISLPINSLLDRHIEQNCLYGDRQLFSTEEKAMHKRLKKELLMLVATLDSFVYEQV